MNTRQTTRTADELCTISPDPHLQFFQSINEQLLHMQKAAEQREIRYEDEAKARREREEQLFKAQMDIERARLKQDRTLADERAAREEAKER